MGFFWKKIDAAMFDALYECTKSTPESLIANIASNETIAKDQKITTWFHRFIRSCTEDELHALVRFVTGSVTLMPNSSIKLMFVDQSPDHLRPISQTCFRILILPRQYALFTEMKSNLRMYLNNKNTWNVHDALNPMLVDSD